MKYASLRHSFLECILFRVVVNSAITRTYPHPLKPTHTQPKKGHTHPHPPTPSQKKATLTHNRPDQVTKRSHSLTPTQTQPKKGHTHPHPAKKCHSHAHQNILSQKRSLSPTHTHTQLKKMSNTSCIAYKLYLQSCNECCENYCTPCFKQFHSKGALRKHTWMSIGDQVGDSKT